MNYYRPVIDDLTKLEQWNVAWQVIDSIAPHVPKDLAGYDLLHYLNHKSKRYELAVKYGELALGASADPREKVAIRQNLSKSYLNANHPEKSVQLLQTNMRTPGYDSDTRLDLAVALYAANKKQEAETVLRSCISDGFNDPKNAEIAQFNLGTYEIRAGNFRKGMEMLASGRALGVWGSKTHNFPIPLWDGVYRPGKKLMIVGEGGIGDEILNIRFVEKIVSMGMIVSVASCQNMAAVFSRLPVASASNYVKFTTDISDIVQYDYWTPIMDLPFTLGLESDELWSGRYLSVDPIVADKWKWIADDTKFKIAVRWSGNPLYEHDLHRTVPIKQLYAALSSIPNVSLYSIQKDVSDTEMANYPALVNLDNKLKTFDDTLAVIDQMDLVVSSCTSVAHAAGALDKPTIIMLPIMNYYTWAQETSKSDWYGDNVTLVRQTKPRTWDDVIASTAQMVKEAAQR